MDFMAVMDNGKGIKGVCCVNLQFYSLGNGLDCGLVLEIYYTHVSLI